MSEVTVEYGGENVVDLPGGTEAFQEETTMMFGEFEVSGFETTSGYGYFVSLEGHLGLASAIVLTHALRLGEPTQCYIDQGPPPALVDEPLQDLTAEWYPESIAEMGLPEKRLEKRAINYDAEMISLSKLEHYTRLWLSSTG